MDNEQMSLESNFVVPSYVASVRFALFALRFITIRLERAFVRFILDYHAG